MIFKNILLAFQLENYDTTRFLRFIYTHPKFWLYGSSRQLIVWTNKATILMILSFVLSIIDILFCYLLFLNQLDIYLLLILAVLILIIFFPLYMVLGNIILYPLDCYLKKQIITRAKVKLGELKNIKIIGITGSYGKTSTKDALKVILSTKFNVLTTEGNKNTPLGVSDVILNKLDDSYDIFIVEMGAYEKGDIKELCDLVKPDIGVLTGITFQHLERFGSIENIIDAKFELIESIDENGLAVLDISSESVVKGLKEKQDNLEVKNILKIENSKDYQYLDDFRGIKFNYDANSIETSLLAVHSINTITIGYVLAKYLGFNTSEILQGINNIKATEHRMQPIYNPQTDIWVIDDSYNGNYESVKSMIRFLTEVKVKGRKLYLTPGLTELGTKTEEIHFKIGEMLASCLDKALIIKNKSSIHIVKGLLSKGFDEKDIIVYETTENAHKDLSNILTSGDLIVFQNDWTDNYF